jgi:hypothetical protein
VLVLALCSTGTTTLTAPGVAFLILVFALIAIGIAALVTWFLSFAGMGFAQHSGMWAIGIILLTPR